MRRPSIALAAALAASAGISPLHAQRPAKQALPPARPSVVVATPQTALESQLTYRTGTVPLGSDIATLTLSPDFRFLEPADAKKLIIDGWGNPANTAEGVIGVIVPAATSPMSEDGWGVVIEYKDDGYIDDTDAAKIDYAELLQKMQEATRLQNEERKKQGFGTVTLTGWAEQPTYDAATHKMFWAKELAFGTDSLHTLNYNVRVLGRRGVLELNAVGTMAQLPAIRTGMQSVLTQVEFNPGHRYADYVKGSDKLATYGVAGLVAGALAAKAGLFKGLIALLVAGKKLVFVAFAALLGMVKKFFGKGDTTKAG